MKKYAIAFFVMITSLNLLFVVSFGQSRNSSRDGDKKANNRRPAPTIDPKKERPTLVNQGNDEIVELAEDDEDVISIDTNLVTIPVRVLDRNGRFIDGLEKKDFKVFEDKTQQEIAYFTNEQKPFTVALVLDMSYSTTFKIDEIQQAALQFVNELRPNDKVMVVSFDDEYHVLCEPTSDRKVIRSAIVQTRISTGTSLYEAVDFVINKRLNKIEGRKAIVLFTDGVDTSSRTVRDSHNLRDASELDALIYPIHYDTFADVQAIENGKIRINDPNKMPPTTPPIGGGNIPITGNKNPILFPTGGTIGGSRTERRGTSDGSGTTREEYRLAEEYLQKMAMRTGGRIYEATTASSLTRAFSKIASELREFYSLGYYPSEDKEAGKRRKIKVRVNRKKVAVRARTSYIVKKKAEK